MKYFTVIATVAQVEGTLHLTDAQAAALKSALKPLPGPASHFVTTAPVGFKKGEVFGWETPELPRALRATLEPVKVDFAKRIESERAAAAAARDKALAARQAPQKKPAAGRGLFAGAGA